MAFPTRVNAITGFNTVNSPVDWTISLTGLTLVSGDLLVLLLGIDGATVATGASGWTKLDTDINSTAVCGDVFWKVSNGSETSVVAAGIGEHGSWQVLQYRNAGTPTASSANGSSTNANPPSHTAVASEDHTWVAAMANDSTTNPSAAPSGYGNYLTNANTDASGANMASADLQVAGTQTQDPGTFTSATDQWVTFTIALPYLASGSVASSSGSATCAAIGFALALAVAVSAGVATVTSVGSATAAAISVSAGLATGSGIGAGTAAAAGASAGVAQASGIGDATSVGVASSSGVATTDGIATSTASAVGTVAGSAVGLAVGASTAEGVGSSSGSASVSGTSESGEIESGAGASVGSSTGVGVGASTAAGTGASAGLGTAIGLGASTVASAGTSAGSTTASAVSGAATFERVGTQIFTRLGLGGPLAALGVVVPAELAPTADVIVHVQVDVGIIQVRPDVGTIQVRPDPVTVEI